MTTWLRLRTMALVLFGTHFIAPSARADCTLTNLGIAPLNEMAFGTYAGIKGGLYPNGLNARPSAHEAAGMALAQSIQPLDAVGNVNTNTGKIGLLSLGMSNVTLEWAVGGPDSFTGQATNDPSLNPRVVIADGAISSHDATHWTNLFSTNWVTVVTQRLVTAGLTTNQVQVVWLKQALQFAGTYGAFPTHARKLQEAEEQILRNAKVLFPNLKIAYLSSRTRAYTNASVLAPNPEPYAFESGFSVRWVIEDQIKATNNLNYNPTNGPVVAPWISWGPYLWADGTLPRGDGFVWLCADTFLSDFTHPTTTGGVPKVAAQLLAFFKTDPTATPWFLKKPGAGAPTCAPTASVTNGFRPLTVNFSGNPTAGSAPFHDGKWTFEDGEFATNLNPVKVFKTPGTYRARFTVTDTNGNTAPGGVSIKVNAKWTDWLADKFTVAERSNQQITGPSADPDGDKLPNLLEYATGQEPTETNPASVFGMTLTNGYFALTFPHYKYAADVALTLEVSSDFTTWNPVVLLPFEELEPVERLIHQEPQTNQAPRFFRLKTQLQPVQ